MDLGTSALMSSWVRVPGGSPFPIENLPYGVFSPGRSAARVGVAIGDHVVDVAAVLGDDVFAAPSLNGFLSRGKSAWAATRSRLRELLTDERHRKAVEPHLFRRADVTMHLPVEIADYVDFYAFEHHAANVGRIFRPDGEPLTANWKHLPIGYHGRAGTIVVSGTPIVRPSGQRKPGPDQPPTYGPSRRLDIEAEIGFVVGVPSRLGEPVPVHAFRDHVFGVVLVNDWSARDIQAWEYVPLGPFLGKSFATSISAWVVPLEALENAWVRGPSQDPPPLDYLREVEPSGLDLTVEVAWNGTVVTRPLAREMYWRPAQQLAHLTANGASLRAGDLYASGTVSGPARASSGCFLELTWNGTEPVELADGTARTFLDDGDAVTIRATAPGAGGVPIGLGEVTGTVVGR